MRLLGLGLESSSLQIFLAAFHSSSHSRLLEPPKLPRFSKGGNIGGKLSVGQDNGGGLVSQFQSASPLPSGGGQIAAPTGPMLMGELPFAYNAFARRHQGHQLCRSCSSHAARPAQFDESLGDQAPLAIPFVELCWKAKNEFVHYQWMMM